MKFLLSIFAIWSSITSVDSQTCPSGTLFVDTMDRPGDDIVSFGVPASTVMECCDACASNTSCISFVYSAITSKCFLKDKIPLMDGLNTTMEPAIREIVLRPGLSTGVLGWDGRLRCAIDITGVPGDVYDPAVYESVFGAGTYMGYDDQPLPYVYDDPECLFNFDGIEEFIDISTDLKTVTLQISGPASSALNIRTIMLSEFPVKITSFTLDTSSYQWDNSSLELSTSFTDTSISVAMPLTAQLPTAATVWSAQFSITYERLP